MGRKKPRCQAERRSDPQINGSLRSDNAADGLFPAHPKGDTLFGRPRRRSDFLLKLPQARALRRRSLMAAENRVVAGSLAIFRGTKRSREGQLIPGIDDVHLLDNI
jgi:hypothetical protein